MNPSPGLDAEKLFEGSQLSGSTVWLILKPLEGGFRSMEEVLYTISFCYGHSTIHLSHILVFKGVSGWRFKDLIGVLRNADVHGRAADNAGPIA